MLWQSSVTYDYEKMKIQRLHRGDGGTMGGTGGTIGGTGGRIGRTGGTIGGTGEITGGEWATAI